MQPDTSSFARHLRNATRQQLTALCVTLMLLGAVMMLSGCNLTRSSATAAPSFSISYQSPVNGDTVAEGVPIQITLTARDSDGSGVARVDLLIDDTLHQRGNPVENIAVPVFTVAMDWTPRGAGLHVLRAIAYRTDGSTAESSINVLVAPAGMIPTPDLIANT